MNVWQKNYLGSLDLKSDFITVFKIGESVFDVVYGYGKVADIEIGIKDDNYPVKVVFDPGHINGVEEYYSHKGESLESDRVTLFKSKSDAIIHLSKAKRSSSYCRILNFYDDGSMSEHIDSQSAVAGQVYHEYHSSKKLVKRHEVQWSQPCL